MKQAVLGIDTSNYTTSLAAVDFDGNVILNLKKLLPVAKGERGLRQSDAVFLHTKAIPELIELAKRFFESSGEDVRFEAVGYSFAPRDVDGSYMPCFLVGESVAKSVALGAGVPVYSFSHQAGHVMAALYSSETMSILNRGFAAFHVSGGTTELLLVEPDDDKILSVEKIGGTLDISAGQLVDRIGVMLGFDFPAGKYVDEAALSFTGELKGVQVRVTDLYSNFSGAENQAVKMQTEYNDSSRTAAFVLEFISQTLLKMSYQLREKKPGIPIVYSGGVMSSQYIKRQLSPVNGYYASPEFSSDNATGCALLTLEKHRRTVRDE